MLWETTLLLEVIAGALESDLGADRLGVDGGLVRFYSGASIWKKLRWPTIGSRRVWFDLVLVQVRSLAGMEFGSNGSAFEDGSLPGLMHRQDLDNSTHRRVHYRLCRTRTGRRLVRREASGTGRRVHPWRLRRSDLTSRFPSPINSTSALCGFQHFFTFFFVGLRGSGGGGGVGDREA
ncbi:hypothetical protein ABKV19_001653 [Rosa sericea]